MYRPHDDNHEVNDDPITPLLFPAIPKEEKYPHAGFIYHLRKIISLWPVKSS